MVNRQNRLLSIASIAAHLSKRLIIDKEYRDARADRPPRCASHLARSLKLPHAAMAVRE
jgi:hypothetical protein